MCSLVKFDIDLKGLKDVETEYSYSLDREYFDAVEASEASDGSLTAKVVVRKTTDTLFELDFKINGEVTVQCDRCLEDMSQAVDASGRLVAKFGDEESDNDDLVMVDENEGVLNVAWYIYEFIVLALPIKHVHAPGKCNRAMIEMLAELSATRSSDEEEEKTVDPRWDALKNLKIEN